MYLLLEYIYVLGGVPSPRPPCFFSGGKRKRKHMTNLEIYAQRLPRGKVRQTFFPRLNYAGKEKMFCRILYKTRIRAGGKAHHASRLFTAISNLISSNIQRFRGKLKSRTDQWPARDFNFHRKIIIGKEFPIPNPIPIPIPTGKEKSFVGFYIKHRSPRGGLPTTLLSPDLCPTISKPHTTRENLGEVGGDRPLGIVGSTVFSSAGEALKRVENWGRNAKQIGWILCFRDAKNRSRTGNLTGNRGGNRWAIGGNRGGVVGNRPFL